MPNALEIRMINAIMDRKMTSFHALKWNRSVLFEYVFVACALGRLACRALLLRRRFLPRFSVQIAELTGSDQRVLSARLPTTWPTSCFGRYYKFQLCQ